MIAGLTESQVRFVVVGMVAGQIYGSRIATFDLDIVYDTDESNIDRIVLYLLSIDAFIKETWPNEGVASEFSRAALIRERSLTLGTNEGEVNILDRIDGLGDYSAVLEKSASIEMSTGNEARFLTLEGLIEAKRASNREKDRLHVVELEALAEIDRQRSKGR